MGTSSWRRVAAAVGLSVTAAVHADLVPDHLREAPYAGVLFIALAVTALLVASVLLATGSRAAWIAAGAQCASAIVAYVVSRSVGLPLMSDDIGAWLDPLGVAALASELIVLALAVTSVAAQPRMISRIGPPGVAVRSPSS